MRKIVDSFDYLDGFCSKEQYRKTLMRPYCDKANHCIVATDSVKMLMIDVKDYNYTAESGAVLDGDDGQIITRPIDYPDYRNVFKGIGDAIASGTLSVPKFFKRLKRSEMFVSIKQEEGTAKLDLSWHQFGDPSALVRLDASLLSAFAGETLDISIYGKSKPIMLRFNGNMTIYIMPIRD